MRTICAVGILANIVKQILAESVERNAFHEPRRDDPVGIDIIARGTNTARPAPK